MQSLKKAFKLFLSFLSLRLRLKGWLCLTISRIYRAPFEFFLLSTLIHKGWWFLFSIDFSLQKSMKLFRIVCTLYRVHFRLSYIIQFNPWNKDIWVFLVLRSLSQEVCRFTQNGRRWNFFQELCFFKRIVKSSFFLHAFSDSFSRTPL